MDIKKSILVMAMILFSLSVVSASTIEYHGLPFAGVDSVSPEVGGKITITSVVNIGDGFSLIMATGGTQTRCYLKDVGENYIENNTVIDGRSNFTTELVSGTEYILSCDNEGSAYNRNFSVVGSYPREGTNLNWTSGYIAGEPNLGNTTRISNFVGLEYSLNEVIVSLLSPPNETINNGSILNFNASLEASGTYNLTNATLFIWNSTNDIYNQTTIEVTGKLNNSQWDVNLSDIDDYEWNVYACAVNSSDTLCQYAQSNRSISSLVIVEDFSPTLIEGEQTNLEINLTFIGIDTSILSNLYWNNTEYSPSKAIIGADTVTFSVTLTVPAGTGTVTGRNISHYWNYYLPDGSLNQTTDEENQTVYSLAIDDCSAYTTELMNLTLYDEEGRTILPVSQNGSIEVDLEIFNLERTQTLASYSAEFNPVNNVSICINGGVLTENNLSLDMVAEYSADDYVTEFYYMDNESINNVTTPLIIDLYNLLTADSTTFLFSFLNEANVEVPNAIVHVYRYYVGNGSLIEVERAKQDDNGETHIHLVEEDVVYQFEITLYGESIFTSTQYNAKCISVPCQIELEEDTEFESFGSNWDLMEGGSYLIDSDGTTRTVNLSFVSENQIVMNLTVAKQDYTGDVEVVGSQQATANSGTLEVTVPQSAGNVTYYAIVYRNGEYIAHEPVDFTDKTDHLGNTGRVMGFLTLVVLILMGATEGVLFFVFLIFALIFVGALALFNFGYYALIGFACALGIVLFKAIKRGRRR